MLFYKVLTEMTGIQMNNEADLFATIDNLSKEKKNMIKSQWHYKK